MEHEKKACAVCGKGFKPTSGRSRYCSDRCKFGTATCDICGKEFVLNKNVSGRFCSLRCWYAAPKERIYEDRTCLQCGKVFRPGTATQLRCSEVCRILGLRKPRKYTHCLNCGKEIRASANRKTKFCSRKCALSKNSHRGIPHAELGHVSSASCGYMRVKVGKDYPGANNMGWIAQHRYIMQEHLGRNLDPREFVHHKNGNRADNHIENLELWTLDHHKDLPGIRLTDHILDEFGMLDRKVKKQMLRKLEKLV